LCYFNNIGANITGAGGFRGFSGFSKNFFNLKVLEKVPLFCNYSKDSYFLQEMPSAYQLSASGNAFFEGKDDNLTIITRAFFTSGHNLEGGAIFVAGTFTLPRFFKF
jgi:hypothetical protein